MNLKFSVNDYLTPEKLVNPEYEHRFRYIVLKEHHIDEVVSFLSEHFANDEPMTKVLGVSKSELHDYIREICREVIPRGLSMGAQDIATGEIVVTVIAEDFASNPEYLNHVSSLCPGILPVMELMESLIASYFGDPNDIKAGQVIHLFMGAGSRSARGSGIVRNTLLRTLENARRQGYLRFIAEATGPGSQKLLENRATVLSEIFYKRFKYKGKFVFKNITGAESCQLMSGSI